MILAVALAAAAPAAPARPELAPLAFLVGACWRTATPDGGSDTHCFETIYGGQHIRDRHQVRAAKTGRIVYGGETVYSWDGAAGAVVFTYWNSLGGISRGTLRVEGDALAFPGQRYSAPDGKTFVLDTVWRRSGPARYRSETRASGGSGPPRIADFVRVTGGRATKR